MLMGRTRVLLTIYCLWVIGYGVRRFKPNTCSYPLLSVEPAMTVELTYPHWLYTFRPFLPTEAKLILMRRKRELLDPYNSLKSRVARLDDDLFWIGRTRTKTQDENDRKPRTSRSRKRKTESSASLGLCLKLSLLSLVDRWLLTK